MLQGVGSILHSGNFCRVAGDQVVGKNKVGWSRGFVCRSVKTFPPCLGDGKSEVKRAVLQISGVILVIEEESSCEAASSFGSMVLTVIGQCGATVM